MHIFKRDAVSNTPVKDADQPRIVVFPSAKSQNPESATKSTSNLTAIKITQPLKNPPAQVRVSRKPAVNPDFAFEILQCEMQLQGNETADKGTVTRMFELYKTGIEFYNFRQQSKKEDFFRKKLEYLTNHPSVLKMLHDQNQKQDHFYLKKHVERLVEVNTQKATGSLNDLVRTAEEAEKKVQERVSQNINNQVEAIKQRIQKRKIASRAGSTAGKETRSEMMDAQQHFDFTSNSKNDLTASRRMKGDGSLKKITVSTFAVGDTDDSYKKYFVDGYKDA